MRSRTSAFVLLVALLGAPASAQDASAAFYQAIRQDDLATLRMLITAHGAGLKDSRGQTALMSAAAFGSVEAMTLLLANGADASAVSASGVTALHWCAGDDKKVRLLIDHGAKVDVRSQIGRTPLLVAAGTHGALGTVKLLLEKAADLNVADSTGVTPLIAATNVNDTSVARLLIERGADVNARATIGQAATPLMAAAHNGNVPLTRLLLARGARLDTVSADRTGLVKNGPVLFGTATALHFATLGGSAEVVKLLLDAGAAVNPQDVRGMTPLMWSVATDRPDPEIVRLLLRKDADPAVRSKAAESAVDWARKFNHPAVLTELKLAPASAGTATARLPVTHDAPGTPREAVERSMPLLQRSAAAMFTDGGCIACHAQPVTAMAVSLARARQWRVDESAAAAATKTIGAVWVADQALLQGREGGGLPDTQVYNTMMAAAERQPSSRTTDAIAHYVAAKQREVGNWHGVGAARSPIQDGDFSRTAMSIRALAAYGMPGRKAEFEDRIQRAAQWLAKQRPVTTEDRVMQLLGLAWAGADARLRETRTRELIAAQRPDGGWAQTPHLTSDAYATGQVLYALDQMSVAASHPARRRGVEFLLRTQNADGTWFVASRAMKIQPYFESGFPYGHDQWISSAATAWAAMALSLSAPASPTLQTSK